MEYNSPEPSERLRLPEASIQDLAAERPGGSGSCIQGLSEDSEVELNLDLSGPVHAEEETEPLGFMATNVVDYGTPDFTDDTQREFIYISQRYPGVVFHFQKYNSVTKRSVTRLYYRCVACWAASGQEKQKNPRCFGGFAIVQGGYIVGHDPDYPPFATGHPCQGGQLTHWPTAALLVKEPSASSDEAEELVPARSLAKPKKEARDAVVEAFAAKAPKRLRHSISTLQEGTPSSSTASGSSNMPSFGAAIREPRGTAVFYRSTFYPDHVFKFELSGEHSYSGKTRRFYFCTDCQALGQQQPVPVITEDHRFILRDPDWPANAPHACMQSGQFSKHQLPS